MSSADAPARIAPACSGASKEYTAVFCSSVASTSGIPSRCGATVLVTSLSSPARRDEDGPVEDVEQSATGGGVDVELRHDAVRLAEREVAGEQCRGLTPRARLSLVGTERRAPCGEGPEHIGRASAYQVAVDHVVVDDERRMQELEGYGQLRCGILVGATEPCMGREDERRTSPLAAGAGLFELVPECDVVRAVVAGPQPGRCEVAVELALDAGRRDVDHENRSSCSSCMTIHGLNAHGVSRAALATAAGSAQTNSATSRGSGSGSPVVRAT